MTKIRFVGILWAVCCSLMVSAASSDATDLVFIHSPKRSVAEQERLKRATDFYGLNLKVVAADSPIDDREISKAVQGKENVGVAITADALAFVNRNSLRRALRRGQGESIPLLIMGIGTEVDPEVLEYWTDGAVLSCRRFEHLLQPQYMFGRVEEFTSQLTNLQIPGGSQDGSYLVPVGETSTKPIISVRDAQKVFPVFMVANAQKMKIFLAAKSQWDSISIAGGIVGVFLQVAPEIIFVRYCAGERGWHLPHHFANFTIDDPWLRQPYGYLDYKGLLREMEAHNFHTTIAFIPWNFNRSEPEVVALFQDHPERFSISIHGNNHDHKEFTDYRNKSLDVQIGDLKQSLARMDNFEALTKIPYDRVMIFPHSIAPEGTLDALKTYNYLATVNSSNVPEGSAGPSDVSFALRPITVSYAGFPSIARYSTAGLIPEEFLAVNEFLGNPILLYAHSDFFVNGINAFDTIADEINKREPDTQWCGLGKIASHFYLIKLRNDSNYDVLAFTGNISLENASGRDAVFHLQKQEIGHQLIKSVTVDGRPYPYRKENGYLNLNVAVSKGASRNVSIQYQNDLVLASIDPSSNSTVVCLLRLASDFRDIYLARSKFGLAAIRVYNGHHLKPLQVLGGMAVLLIICIVVGFRLREFLGTRRLELKGINSRSPID